MVYSLSREAWSKESNWIGYVMCRPAPRRQIRGPASSRCAAPSKPRVGRRAQARPDRPDDPAEGDPARGHVGVMKGWYVIYTSTDERSPFSSTARATSSWPRCGNWSPSTSRAPIHISSGKKNLFRKAGC
ncbi:hypothetical protein ZWY2020_005642 [Hordeum vulgare]|nr:hypothetical protein ZWY2020_005642 [Hordeum vulgare]